MNVQPMTRGEVHKLVVSGKTAREVHAVGARPSFLRSSGQQRDLTGRRFRPRIEPLEGRLTPAFIGGLDYTFDGDGIRIDTALQSATDVAVDAFERVYIAGSASGPGGYDFAVLRLNPDGSRDATFGDGGIRTIDFGGDDRANALALDAAGNVVLAGGSSLRFAVVRLTPGGDLDPTFNGTGFVRFGIEAGASDTATGVAIDPADGGILVGGYSALGTVTQFAAARLTPGGDLDPAFAGDGTTAFPIDPGVNAWAYDLALDPSRRIVLAGGVGVTGLPAVRKYAAARLLPDGTLDPAFAGDGTANLDPGGGANLSSLFQAATTDAAGNIYLAGGRDNEAGESAMDVYRLLPDGTPDPAFDGDGRAVIGGAKRISAARAVALQPDGKVVAAGDGAFTSWLALETGVARLNPDGSRDVTFNPTAENGARPGVTLLPGLYTYVGGVAVGPTGRIVLATTTGHATALIARFIGRLESTRELVVGGPTDGSAGVFVADSTGLFASTPAATLDPFPGFTGAVRAASADVNGDGVEDTVLVTGAGTSVRFTVVDGADHTTLLVAPTAPFAGSESFTGGGFVAAADLDGDGCAEFAITPDQGGGPRVTVFSLVSGAATVRADFFGIDDPNFRGGARVALGDVSRDGIPDLLVAAGFGGGPRFTLFDGARVFGSLTVFANYFAFPDDAATLRNGVFAALGDVDADGYADLAFGGGSGGAPRVYVLSGQRLMAGDAALFSSPAANFFVAGNGADRGGVRVAFKDTDGDAQADIVVGSGEGSSAKVRVYLGKYLAAGTGEPTMFQDLPVFGGSVLTDGVYVG